MWNQSDIDCLGNTLTELVMPNHAGYVDGTSRGSGWIADGWPKLGRFSSRIQLALQNYDVSSQGQYIATMAANARRLGLS